MNIPENWTAKKIKYCAKLSPSCDTSKLLPNSEVTFTPMECIRNGYFINRKSTFSALNNSYTQYQEGDIVIAKVTPCFENGNIAEMHGLYSGFGFGSSELFVLRPYGIESRFLFYALQNEELKENGCATMTGTGGLKRVSPSFIENYYITLPTVEEQKRISAFLDSKCAEIDAVLAKTRASIEEYRKLKQAIITQTVTKGIRGDRPMKESGIEWIGEIPADWETIALKKCVDILPGYAFSSQDFNAENGIPLLRGINVGLNEIRWENVVYWNKPLNESLETFRLEENDIVVGLDRPWITGGTRVAFVQKCDLPCLLLQRVCRIRPRVDIDRRLISYWISSDMFKEALSNSTTGVSVPHISTKQIEQFIIAIPPNHDDKEICDYLDKQCKGIDVLIQKKEHLLAELESYKKSLIYEYVTGKRMCLKYVR